jgi:GTPase SAR1 family protein
MSGKENRPFNVLVLGQTQAGKSSLIKKLQQLSVTKEHNSPRVGRSGRSVTTDVTMYPLKLPYTDWQLIEKSSGKQVKVPQDEDSILKRKGLAKRKDLTVDAVSSDPEYIYINLIDTPGLSDSEGRDAQHICNVLEALDRNSKSGNSALKYISAIFLVIMSTSPFSRNAKEIFKYYEKCMPNLFRGAAIINTNFTVAEWRSDYQQAKEEHGDSILPMANTRLKRMQARCDALDNDPDFKNGCSSLHFFIDSNPAEEFPFEEYTARNQITDILRFVKYQPSMPIKEMWLCKTDDWLAVDAVLIDWLRTARQLFEDSEKNILGKASNGEKVYANTIKLLNSTTSEIETIEEKLAMLDVDTEYTLAMENTAAKSFLEVAGSAALWRGARDSLTIQVSKVDQFHVTASDNETGKWTSRGQTPASGSWTGHYQALWGKSPKLIARAWTVTREFHSAEVTDLKERKKRLVTQREECLFNADILKPDNASQGREEALKLGRFVGTCDAIIRKLNADKLPLNDKSNTFAMKRYQRRQNNNQPQVTQDDLYRIAYLEDPELPYALAVNAKTICVNSINAVDEKSFWNELEEISAEPDSKVEKEEDAQKATAPRTAKQPEEQPPVTPPNAQNPNNTTIPIQTQPLNPQSTIPQQQFNDEGGVVSDSESPMPGKSTSPPAYYLLGTPDALNSMSGSNAHESLVSSPTEVEVKNYPEVRNHDAAEAQTESREGRKANCCVIL